MLGQVVLVGFITPLAEWNFFFSSPVARALLLMEAGGGGEINARDLLRLGWSQLTWEDEELGSCWGLPVLITFVE